MYYALCYFNVYNKYLYKYNKYKYINTICIYIIKNTNCINIFIFLNDAGCLSVPDWTAVQKYETLFIIKLYFYILFWDLIMDFYIICNTSGALM